MNSAVNSIHPGYYSDTYQGSPVIVPTNAGMPGVPVKLVLSTGFMAADSVAFVIEQSLTGQQWNPIIPNVVILGTNRSEIRSVTVNQQYVRVQAVFIHNTDAWGLVTATVIY